MAGLGKGRPKTIDEMRQYRDVLNKAMNAPCCCAGTSHDVECVLGKECMKGGLKAISWAIGEYELHQGFVDAMITRFG